MAGLPACDSEQSSPAQAASEPRKALNITKDAGEDTEIEIFPFPVFRPIIDIPRQARNLKQLARLTQEQGTQYIPLPHTCLVVVHEKYWLAILHKNN
jgi:hypothetical protein